MGLKRTDQFRQDAVRIALTSGLMRKQVADDLGVGMSTLNKWITTHRDTDVVSKEDSGLASENERLRREVRRLCDVVGVSTRGLRAFRSRPASRRQRSDLVTPAHIKEQSRLSLGSYGRPRMTEELKEIGLDVGHRRAGRLMRQTSISVIRPRKHKVTTDSDHKLNIAPNLLDRDFTADQPTQKWVGDISYVWTREGRLRWRSSNTSMAFAIRVDGTQHWAGKALSPSNGKWPKRALGAALKRDWSKCFRSASTGLECG